MARGHHDIGGLPGAGPIDQSEHQLSDWEILADAVNQALGARGIKRKMKCAALAKKWTPQPTVT